MKKTIAVLPGDGVGPEVVSESVRVLKKVAEKFNHQFNFEYGLIGAAAIDKNRDPYPMETHILCKKSDAILFGAIGDPKYDNNPKAKVRPEGGLLRMRKSLGLYANIRPIKVFPSLVDRSPLRKEVVDGTDFVVIRELIGGIYFGKRGRKNYGQVAYDTSTYSVDEIARVAEQAFELAMKRRCKVTVVDKANVLETSRLWRETVDKLKVRYKKLEIEYMFVDNCAMQIIKNPKRFDVILTENMFGDILTDEASVIAGSIGMLPSASFGENTSLYEPIHGSYPKAAGKNIANPTGAILSAAMLLDHSFGMKKESRSISKAVKKALEKGYGTRDIVLKNPTGTKEFGDAIISFI